MKTCSQHDFIERDGLLNPCSRCGFKPFDYIVAANQAIDRARNALLKASEVASSGVSIFTIISGALYDVGKIVRSTEVIYSDEKTEK